MAVLLQIGIHFGMQICMKLDALSSETLKARIRERGKNQSYSEIGEAAGVHPSQVSRICRGEFRTLSHNVVQVCKALGIEMQTVRLKTPVKEALTKRLERSVLDVWDQTPADAERLVRFLSYLAELRRPPR
jgi:transcriptional regulator with XRE-family HTH domain